MLAYAVAALASALACAAVVVHATPIDAALPFLAVVLVFVAALGHSTLTASVLLLMAGEIAIPHEHTRLLFFGLVLAATFAAALFLARERLTVTTAASFAVAAIVLLRWIPFPELWFREVVLLLFAVAIVAALGNSAIAVAIATAVALLTPAFPLRTFFFPLAVLVAILVLRLAGMPRLRAELTGALATGAMLLFFAWSGVVARGLPYLLQGPAPEPPRTVVAASLTANQSTTIALPDDAQALVVSGANVPRLRRGTVVGRIEPGSLPIRIGDLADWGYMRREHYYAARNVLPRNPAGRLRDYGYGAWLDGAGRIELPRDARTIVVTADPSLPNGARLQIDYIETVPR